MSPRIMLVAYAAIGGAIGTAARASVVVCLAGTFIGFALARMLLTASRA